MSSRSGGGGNWDNNTFAYLLLGDPELTIRRKTVLNFRLVASNLLFGAGSKITVRGLFNAPVPLTLVNVYLSSGGTVNGFTGTDGSLVLSNVPPSTITGLDLHADGYPSETTPMGAVLRAISYNIQGFVLRVEGSPGNYQIQRSTDLLMWPGIGTVTIPANGTFANSRGNAGWTACSTPASRTGTGVAMSASTTSSPGKWASEWTSTCPTTAATWWMPCSAI